MSNLFLVSKNYFEVSLGASLAFCRHLGPLLGSMNHFLGRIFWLFAAGLCPYPTKYTFRTCTQMYNEEY